MPNFVAGIKTELERMVPSDVAVRMVDRLTADMGTSSRDNASYNLITKIMEVVARTPSINTAKPTAKCS